MPTARPCLAAFVLLAACSARPPVATLRPLRMPGAEGELREILVRVPEVRDRAGGRMITLRAVVLPARGTPAPDPLIFLAGGPGQAASSLAAFAADFLGDVRARRDIVLFDVRGTGGSAPLRYEPRPEELLAEPEAILPVAWARRAAAELAQRADLAAYTTRESVEDLRALCAAMGWARVNLYATSYGTRLALELARAHPALVRTMTLKGVVPPGLAVGLDYARDMQASLERLFADAPAARADLAAALARLEQQPVDVSVVNPASGSPERLRVTRPLLAAVLRSLLYNPTSRAGIPALLAAAARGELGGVAALAVKIRVAYVDALYLGAALSVLAAEDAPLLDAQRVEEGARGTILGTLVADNVQAATAGWPRAPGHVPFVEPVRAAVPALLLSGGVDPVTPPRHAETAAAFLPRARHIVFPDAGHGGEGFGACGATLIAAFVEAGDAAGLDASCASQPR